jgi:hypothetical protein
LNIHDARSIASFLSPLMVEAILKTTFLICMKNMSSQALQIPIKNFNLTYNYKNNLFETISHA